MSDYLIGIICFVSLFLGMLLFVYLGNRLSVYQTEKHPHKKFFRNKIIEGSIFALMGLLIAFTFSGARERFDVRRALVIDEANAIKTAYLRLDLLSEPIRSSVKKTLKDYLNIRLAIYKKMPHINETLIELQESEKLQRDIWNLSVNHCYHESNSAACIVLLPALNKMIDIANARFESTKIHPPPVIIMTLIILALISAILAGYNISEKSSWPTLHIWVYAAIISFTIFIIINLEYTQFGFIPISYFNDVLVDISKNL
jgi:hypothetical protein